MAKQGPRPIGISVPTPVNMPVLIDLPSTSTSSEERKTSESTSVTPLSKLPLFGPLDIPDYKEFTREQKVKFHERYKQPCAKLNSIDDYKYQYILGRGIISKVVLARRKSEDYVLKIYHKHFLVENNMVQSILEEKRILQSLNCPFCIHLERLFQNTSEIIFIFPFISGGDLFTHLQKHGKFDENMTKFYAAQVVLALDYLHQCDVLHREIKPEALLLDHLGYLKVYQFNSAKIVTTRTFTFCRNPEYVAPEMLEGKGYGKSVDWWAFGNLLYEMLVGHPPFITHSITTTYENIKVGRYTLPPEVGSDIRDLIAKLLRPDVSKRLWSSKRGSEDIKGHKWFKDFDWAKLANRRLEPPLIPGTYRSSINYPTLVKSSSSLLDLENVDEHFKDF